MCNDKTMMNKSMLKLKLGIIDFAFLESFSVLMEAQFQVVYFIGAFVGKELIGMVIGEEFATGEGEIESGGYSNEVWFLLEGVCGHEYFLNRNLFPSDHILV